MKNSHTSFATVPGLSPGQITKSLAGFFLVCLPLTLFSSPAKATDSEQVIVSLGGQLAAGVNPGPVVWGDDTIGALPVVGEHSGSFSAIGPLPLLNHVMTNSQPSFYLEGNIDDLRHLIADVQGDDSSYVYIEPFGNNEARLFFAGPARMTLDRSEFERGRVQVGTLTGAMYGPAALLDFRQGAASIAQMIVSSGAPQDVALRRILNSGLLDNQFLNADVYDGRMKSLGRLELGATDQRLVLQQFQ